MYVAREIKLMHDTPREAIPADVLAALSPEERDAFFRHAESFRRLAAEATHPDLRRYLERAAEEDVFWVKLYSQDESPYRAYFHHTVVEARESFQIRWPRPTATPAHLPPVLEPVYRSLGGFRQEYGGLICPEDIQSIASADRWLSEENQLDPRDCFLFYEIGNGDAVGYTSAGEGVIYEHESGSLVESDLEGFVSEYFRELLGD